MANPVFERALDGLATMVSARAARRVLEAGVRSVAETPETIPAKVMQSLLVNYVHREFEQMLPREGLKRNLEQLAKRVGELSAELSVAPPQPKLPNPYDSSEVDAVTAALSYFTRVNIEPASIKGASSTTDGTISAHTNDATPNDAIPNDVTTDNGVVNVSTTPQTSASEQVMLTEHVTSNGSTSSDNPVTSSASSTSLSEDVPDPQVTSPVNRRSQTQSSTQSSTQQATRRSSSASPASSASSAPKASSAPIMWKDQFDVSAKTDKLKNITREGTTHEGTIMADSTETKLTLSEAQLETIVMKFAQVEHARLVAAVRENGTIVTSRGAGVDLNSLSRFGLMGLRLLERSGHLRSYYLSHTQGQLFLFCFGRDTIIMLGSSDINVGTVFATLTSLKDSL